MYFVIEDFLSFLFAPVISRAWRTRSARRIYFRKTSRWVRAPSIESAPTETPRTHEKARRKCHGLRIIALLYLRSRSYRRTRTRSVGRKCGGGRGERERERILKGLLPGGHYEGNVCVRERLSHVRVIHTAACSRWNQVYVRKRRIIVLAQGRSPDISGVIFRQKSCPSPLSPRRAYATGQSSPKGWIPAMNYRLRVLLTCRRRLVCDGVVR